MPSPTIGRIKRSSHRIITTEDGSLLLEVFSGGVGIEQADAAEVRLVVAWNAHDELVAALEAAVDSLEWLERTLPGTMGYGVRCERIVKANAALAAAKQGAD